MYIRCCHTWQYICWHFYLSVLGVLVSDWRAAHETIVCMCRSVWAPPSRLRPILRLNTDPGRLRNVLLTSQVVSKHKGEVGGGRVVQTIRQTFRGIDRQDIIVQGICIIRVNRITKCSRVLPIGYFSMI